MKLAVLRYAGWTLMGKVDAEGEAIMLGIPLPPPDAPHLYSPREDGVTLSTGALCRHCDNPKGHQVHQQIDGGRDVVADDDEPDELGAGPILVRLYDPVEIHTAIVPMTTQVGTQGLALARVPDVLRQSYVNAHFDRGQWDGLYELEGPDLEGIVQEYLLLRSAPVPAAAVAADRPRGRRIITE